MRFPSQIRKTRTLFLKVVRVYLFDFIDGLDRNAESVHLPIQPFMVDFNEFYDLSEVLPEVQ